MSVTRCERAAHARRSLAASAAVVAACAGGQALAVNPQPSLQTLTFGNGHCAAVYDASRARLTTLRDHVYARRSAAEETVNLAYDAYFGVRVAGSSAWLAELPATASYVPGTAVIKVVQQHGGLLVEQYFFSPFELPAPAVVMLAHVTTSSGKPLQDAALFSLHNFHLGDGPDRFAGERIDYDGATYSFVERGTTTGRALLVRSLTPPQRHGASPENPYGLVAAGADLVDVASSGVRDDAVCGFQYDLAGVGGASAAGVWHGALHVAGQDPLALAKLADAYLRGRDPATLLADELQAWTDWHSATVDPPAASADELAVYRQALATLRIGQCREPNDAAAGATPHGQLVASLPPGKWDIAWVRDAAYGIAALARAGHVREARDALIFMLRGRAGTYLCCDAAGEPYVGQPYAISVTRYYGDGSEESDHNADGPNVEFDNFGLFLWATAEVLEQLPATERATFVEQWRGALFAGVADVLVALIEPQTGLLRADSSIWEHHWDNGKRRHHTYSNVFAVVGLRAAARLAALIGDAAAEQRYDDASAKIEQAIAAHLVDPTTSILASDLESLPLGVAGYMDAAVVEAFNHRVSDPQGPVAAATLAGFDAHLRTAHGPGYKRNDDGDAYDEREWVIVDLRVASARFARREQLAGQALLDWITAQARANRDLIPELLDQHDGAFAGEIPMVGFGAGVYALTLFDRARAAAAAPADAGVPAARDAGPGADGGPAPDGTHAADAAPDAGGVVAEPPAEKGCAVVGRAGAPWLLLAALLGLLAHRWRLRRAALSLLAAAALCGQAGCVGFDATDPPAARLAFTLDLPPEATARVVVYDADDRLIGERDGVTGGQAVELALLADTDHAGIRLTASAGERALKAVVPAIARTERIDLGLVDAASTAAAQLVQEKIAGQGGSLSSAPPDALRSLLAQIAALEGAPIPEVTAFVQLVGELLAQAQPAGDAPLFEPLSADLSPAFADARGLSAETVADYRNALTAAAERLTVDLICDASLVRVMFTVDASGQALDGNGTPQLIRQPNKSGRIYLAITVDDTSPVPDGAGVLKAQMVPNDPEMAMLDDGTGGDELAGDGVFTRTLVLPRGMRVKYKYTNGSAGEGWTRTEEWPGNARILLIRDLLTRHSDGSPDCLVIRRDSFGDEASNKNQVNLHRKIKGGTLPFDLDLGGATAAQLPDGRYAGGLALEALKEAPPLTPAGLPEAAENGICARCPAPLTVSADDATPPELISAEFLSTARVLVRFSEAMEYQSASQSTSYLLLDAAHRALPIRAVAASGSQVILEVAPPDFAQHYRLRVRGLRDASANGNPLPDEAEVPVGADRTPPQALGARPATLRDLNPAAEPEDPTIGQVIVVGFDEELDPTSAENAGNYRITDATGRELPLKAAYLRERREVWLVSADQVKGRPYDLAVSGVRDLARNRLRDREPLRFFGFALYKMTFGAVPGFAFLDPQGQARGIPDGERLYLTGTVLAVARDLAGNSIAVSGRTDVTGIPDFEMKPGSEQHHGQPVYTISLLAPPGIYAWKVAHGAPGEHVSPPSTLVKVHKSLCTTNDATGVDIDPVTLTALALRDSEGTPVSYVDFSQATLSVDGTDPPGPFTIPAGAPQPRPKVMFRRENPDEVCALRKADVACPAIIVGTWRDIEAFRVGDKTNDYDDGLPEVAPGRRGADLSPPRLQQLLVRDSESLLLSFDERLAVQAEALTVTARHVERRTALQMRVELVGALGEALLPHQVLLRSEAMDNGAAYELTVSGIADAAGNAAITPLVQSFVAPASFKGFTPLADGKPPRVIGVLPKTPTSLLVQFDEKVQAQAAGDAASYEILAADGEAPTVLAAALQGGGSAVLLSTALQAQQADYTLVVRNIADLASPPNVLVEQRVAFKGFGDSTPPTVVHAAALSSTEVAVAFDEALSPLSAATATSYQIGGLQVLSVDFGGDGARRSASFDPSGARFSDHVVVLRTSPMSPGQSYTVVPAGVTDLSNNPAQGSAAFSGVASAPLVDVVISYKISASDTAAGQVPARAISPATLGAQREGVFLRGSTVSTDGATKGPANDPINLQLGGFPPEGQPLSGPDPQLLDDGTNGDAKAGDGVYSLRIADVPLGTSLLWKAFASYTVAYKASNPNDPQAAFADAAPGPAVFGDGQEFPGNENAARILADPDGDGVVRIDCLFGDETSYKKFTQQPPFAWVTDDLTWTP